MNATIKALTKTLAHNNEHEQLISTLYDEVEPLCITDTDGHNGEETTLYDWLYEGQFSESDTLASIAQEWDELDPSYAEILHQHDR